jgi:hypothetical protein
MNSAAVNMSVQVSLLYADLYSFGCPLRSFKVLSAHGDELSSSFPVYVPFISQTKNSSTVLNKSGESEHPFLVPAFRGNVFSFSSYSIMLQCWP